MWNKNNVLLWQGQLVSSLGDMVYRIGLGFWVLAYTGSTAAMGIVIAAGVLPRGVVGLFAGVWVDRWKRKRIIVFMDLARGLAVLFVAVAAFGGWLNIPIIISVAILVGLCDSFFDPAVSSIIPSITDKEHLVRINSAFSMNRSGTEIIGNVLGGVLFTFLGAPLLFLFNGISYLLSAFSETFITVPPVKHEVEEFDFWTDMREGLVWIRSSKGFMVLLISVLSLNFLLSVGGILYLPYFEGRGDLGPEKFGIAMGILSLTTFAGFMLLSIIKIRNSRRYAWFVLSTIVFLAVRIPLFQFEAYWVICVQLGVIGFAIAQLNSLIDAASQLMVPEHLRGKVFGVLGAMATGLTPLGMALGGILAEFIPIHFIQLVSGILVAVGFIPTLISGEFRRMISQDFTDTQGLEDGRKPEA